MVVRKSGGMSPQEEFENQASEIESEPYFKSFHSFSLPDVYHW